jgi:hypothetical protein
MRIVFVAWAERGFDQQLASSASDDLEVTASEREVVGKWKVSGERQETDTASGMAFVDGTIDACISVDREVGSIS